MYGARAANEKATSAEEQRRASNQYFRMGAVVAIGELYDEGLLGSKEAAAVIARDYLKSFGVRTLADLDELGVRGPYRRDFEGLLPVMA